MKGNAGSLDAMRETCALSAPSRSSGATNGYNNETWAGTPAAADGSIRSRSRRSAMGTSTATMSALSAAAVMAMLRGYAAAGCST